MSNKTKKLARDGRSLAVRHSNVSHRQLVEFGLSEESARRAMLVRRVLPYMEDATIPCIDAERLWVRIGKPYKRFRAWAEQYIKPLLEDVKLNAQISAFEDSSKAGKPSKHYLISRSLAAHLAMLANTEEGHEIRCYFLDMEKIVFKLAEYNQTRVIAPVKLDNRLTHATYKRGLLEPSVHEMKLKSYVCKVLTGLKASEVMAKYGQSVRDLLKHNPDALDVYNTAYNGAVTMYEDGKKWKTIEPVISGIYGGKIQLDKILRTH